MSYYIIETKAGAVAVEGIFAADQVYKRLRKTGDYASIPVPANPYDLVHKMAVLAVEHKDTGKNG